MPAATSSGHVSIEEYRRTSYEPDAEYVDGRIEERPMGEYDHAAWQEALLLWFRQHAAEWGIRVKPELRVQVSATRFRVPDITVLARERPIEPVITKPPLAVFEILSPEDSLSRMLVKLSDYEAMGIPQIWVVEPGRGRAYRYQGGALLPRAEFGAPGEAIHFDFAAVAALLD